MAARCYAAGKMPNYPTEISGKLGRLAVFLDRAGLDGALLWHRANFAWITGGKDNHIPNNSPAGVAAILAMPDRLVCLCNNIEAPRMRDEELTGTGIEIIEYPWFDHDAIVKTSRDLIGNKKIAVDSDETGLGLPPLPADFVQLRWSLTPEEIARYREGGRLTSAAIERACALLRPGQSEHEAAGLLEQQMRAAGLNPVVTLVAADQRINHFRHPIPTNRQIDRVVMLVSCAEFGGLISNLTRFVHFGPIPAERERRMQAVARIDAAVNLATRPGRTMGEIFADLQQAYAENGFAEQWKFHHQGGSTGYAGREAFATPTSQVKVLENQAFAWNPSVTGAKSEDTALCTNSGIEFLTAPSPLWPRIEVTVAGKTLARAGALVL